MTSKIIRREFLVGAAVSAVALTASIKGGHATELKIHQIKIGSFDFEPKHIVVKVGDVISWTNEDLAPHTATAIGESWDTGEIVKGNTHSIKVTEGMETNYFCSFHPHMRGSIELTSVK